MIRYVHQVIEINTHTLHVIVYSLTDLRAQSRLMKFKGHPMSTYTSKIGNVNIPTRFIFLRSIK